MSEADDIFASIGEIEVKCSVLRQPWLTKFFGRVVPFQPKVPIRGECPNLADFRVLTRACPCRTDPRLWPADTDLLTVEIRDGLPVLTELMCADHLAYFRDLVPMPFFCPGCGIIYQSSADLVLESAPVSTQ